MAIETCARSRAVPLLLPLLVALSSVHALAAMTSMSHHDRHAVLDANTAAPATQATAITATCLNQSDCTAELQSALASGADHVHVPLLPGGRAWIVQPLRLYKDQTITLAAGVELLVRAS